jgi:hypothetical protein
VLDWWVSLERCVRERVLVGVSVASVLFISSASESCSQWPQCSATKFFWRDCLADDGCGIYGDDVIRSARTVGASVHVQGYAALLSDHKDRGPIVFAIERRGSKSIDVPASLIMHSTQEVNSPNVVSSTCCHTISTRFSGQHHASSPIPSAETEVLS